jgi:hypothetical protein
MNKKNIVALGIVLILAVVVGGFWVWKGDQKVKLIEEQGQDQNQQQGEDQQAEVDMSDWNTYRNEEYGFEINHPNNWMVVVKNDTNYGDDNKIFFFRKDEKIYFAVFPRGGFGQGVEEPRIEYGKFKEKDAKMFWYDDYPYPSFIYIQKDAPAKWNGENRIELRGEGDNVKVLERIYDSFQFVE